MGEPLDPPANATYTLTAGPPTPPGDGDEDLGLPRGTSVGRYVVLDKLGSGGMGVVLAAYDPELDRKVALKLMRVQATESTSASQGQARLLREAQAMARLSHPNVIAVHDVGTFEDRVFIAMELVDGITVKEWLKERRRSWREILSVFSAAGRGLAAAHAAGIVHRDFKPSNVLIGKDDRVRVMDFGVACAVGSAARGANAERVHAAAAREALAVPAALDTPLTGVGVAVGTPGYMAPEQLEGQSTDARTDQFGFCVTLYESLYGKRPFPVVVSADGTSAIAFSRAPERPPGTRVPRWVHRVLARGLRARPDDRYPSIEALIEELGKDPAVTRRRWLAGAASVALVAVAAAGYQSMAKRQSLLCKGAERKLTAVWDAPRKDAIEKAFATTARPYAHDTWVRVEKTMDAFAHEWVAMHTEACEATRVRGEQSEDILSARMVCLQQRLDEVRALTSLFAEADAQLVDKAVQASQALTDVRECADVTTLMAPVRPPRDEAARAKVQAIRARIAEARALAEAGRYPRGLEIAKAASADAQSLSYRPLEAEALETLGNLERRTGAAKEAEGCFKKAVWAAEAGRHIKLAARASSRLVYVVGHTQGRYEDALEWSEHARAAIEELGGDEDEEAYWARSMANILDTQGKFDEALPLSLKSLALYEKHSRSDDQNIGIAHNNLANILSGLGRHEEAVAHYRQALAITERALGPEHPDLGLALFNLAALHLGLGRYREALDYGQRGLALWEKGLGPQHPDVAACRGLVGRILLASGDIDRGHEHLTRALSFLDAPAPPNARDLAEALEGMGDYLRARGQAKTAHSHYQRAFDITEKALGTSHAALAYSLTGLGLSWLDRKSPARAIEPLERALKLFETDVEDLMLLAKARFALARALWQAGSSPERARTLAEQARKLYANASPENAGRLAEVEEWLAERKN